MADDTIYRQAAIDALREVYEYEYPTASGGFDEYATKLVPNTLKNLPSAQPEPTTHGSISAKTVQKQCNRTIDDCISRQAAIDFIDAGRICNPNEPRWSDNEVVNFLRSRPSAQPKLDENTLSEQQKSDKLGVKTGETCTDCISRQAAIDAVGANTWAGSRIRKLPSAQPERRFDEWCTDCKEYDHERHCCPRFNHVIRTTLQDAQRTGRWKVLDLPKGKMKYCSECGFGQYIADERQYSYCPNCGARMEAE